MKFCKKNDPRYCVTGPANTIIIHIKRLYFNSKSLVMLCLEAREYLFGCNLSSKDKRVLRVYGLRTA